MLAAGTGQQKGPFFTAMHNHTLHSNASKVEQIGLRSFASSSIPDLSPTDYHFFKHLDNFLQGKHFYNQEAAENAFQEFMDPEAQSFILQE